MARWTEIAEWVGPTPNQSGPMVEYRGLVLHIMEGSYAGSIAWGKNPDSNVSFHFATRGDGHIGQLVDTAVTAWTQAAGNGHWISVENEGFSGNPLTAGQVEACAQIYARGVREYGWPLQATDSTTGRGLGWHGMGGAAWGGHFDCPGEPVKAQRPAILARAAQILGLTPTTRKGDAMLIRSGLAGDGSIYYIPGGLTAKGKLAAYAIYPPVLDSFANSGMPYAQLPDGVSVDSLGWYDFDPQPWPAPGGDGGLSGAEISDIVRAELDATHLTGVE